MAELETQIILKETLANDAEQQLKISETQNKMLKDQIQELRVEIDRIKYNSADLNNSLMNMSTLSVNQQMVVDMEQRIHRLESENTCLRDSKADSISAKMLS